MGGAAEEVKAEEEAEGVVEKEGEQKGSPAPNSQSCSCSRCRFSSSLSSG